MDETGHEKTGQAGRAAIVPGDGGVQAAAIQDAAPGQQFSLGPAILFVLTWLGSTGFVVAALLRPVVPGGGWTLAGVALLGIIPVTTLARGFRGDLYPGALTRLVVLRPFWYAMLFLPLLAASGLVGALAGLPFGSAGSAGRVSMGVAGAVLGAASLIGLVGSRRLAVRRLRVPMTGLPAVFDGLRIVQLSDLHVGPHTSRRYLARVVAAVEAAQPDLIVFTGDQVDDFAGDIAHFEAAFRGVAAPLGVFAVAGNHDVLAGWDAVERGLLAMGITVLVNDAVPIQRDGHQFWLAGTGDPMGRGWSRDGGRDVAPDIEATLRRVPPGEPVVALAHNPALWPALARRAVGLTLSGHTHYGQLAIPRLGWSAASAFLDLAMGVHRHGDSLLYINPGTNYWGVPFRIGTPPEVTVLTLYRSPRGSGEAGTITVG